MPYVLILGNRPPPAEGAGYATQAVADYLQVTGYQVEFCDVVRARRSVAAFRSYLLGAWRLGTLPPAVLYIQGMQGERALLNSLMIALARVCGVRVIHHHHGFHFFAQKTALGLSICSPRWQHVTHVVLSQKMRAELENKYGNRRAVTVSNIIFAARFHDSLDRIGRRSRAGSESADSTDLLFVGRAGIGKGEETAKRVACMLRARGRPDLRLTLVGDGHSSSHHLDRCLGLVPRGEVLELMRGASVLFYPTADDAAPLAIYEAILCGIPVIAPAVGCIEDLAEELPGGVTLLLEPSDDDYLKVIEMILEDPGKYSNPKILRAAMRVRESAERSLGLLFSDIPHSATLSAAE